MSATWPRCGHPKTKKNTASNGHATRKYACCRECRNALQRRAYAKRHNRIYTPPVRADAPKLIRPTNPRYLVLMAEAKAEYLAALDREQEARKGGRPKTQTNFGRPSARPQIDATRSTDLCDLLPAYYGRTA